MKKPRDPKHFIKIPGYPGGNKALEAFVKKNLKYPKEALENRIEGTVKVEFDFNHKGVVTKVDVKTGLGHGCDEEAVRLVKLLRFKVAKHRGVRISFHKGINIHFKLNQQQQITYNYKEKDKATIPQKKKGGESYTYIITSTPKE